MGISERLGRLHFPRPLSEEDTKTIFNLLKGGKTYFYVGECLISKDEDENQIWGTDLYGQDSFCSNGIGDLEIMRALAWVERQYDPDFHHPAEGGGGWMGYEDIDWEQAKAERHAEMLRHINEPHREVLIDLPITLEGVERYYRSVDRVENVRFIFGDKGGPSVTLTVDGQGGFDDVLAIDQFGILADFGSRSNIAVSCVLDWASNVTVWPGLAFDWNQIV